MAGPRAPPGPPHVRLRLHTREGGDPEIQARIDAENAPLIARLVREKTGKPIGLGLTGGQPVTEVPARFRTVVRGPIGRNAELRLLRGPEKDVEWVILVVLGRVYDVRERPMRKP